MRVVPHPEAGRQPFTPELRLAGKLGRLEIVVLKGFGANGRNEGGYNRLRTLELRHRTPSDAKEVEHASGA
jgi:hypothetical protein